MSDDNDAGPPPEPTADRPRPEVPAHAWRLTFEYEGDEVRLVGRQRVEMLAPVDDAPLLERGQDGYWIELRDESDGSVYRQVLHEPIATQYEVFSPEPGALPHHVAAPEVRGMFQAVVPDLPQGRSIALHGPAGRGPGSAAAESAGSTDAPRRGPATGKGKGKERPTDEAAGPRTPPPAPRTLLTAPLREEDHDGRG